MAQEYSKRGTTQFDKEIIANKLAAYTIHIIKNEKFFPEEFQKSMAVEITQLVLNIAGKVNRANREYIDKNDIEKAKEAYKKRISLQEEAVEMCETLLDRITTVKLAYNLKTKKAASWARHTKEAKASIKSWQTSEKKKLASL